jgi:hypothetical protein
MLKIHPVRLQYTFVLKGNGELGNPKLDLNGIDTNWLRAYDRNYYRIQVFHSPAFMAAFASFRVPSSIPLPMSAIPLPTCTPGPPVAPATVSPIPRDAAPTTPPTVLVRPPTVLPTVEVTNFAPAYMQATALALSHTRCQQS